MPQSLIPSVASDFTGTTAVQRETGTIQGLVHYPTNLSRYIVVIRTLLLNPLFFTILWDRAIPCPYICRPDLPVEGDIYHDDGVLAMTRWITW